MHNATVYDFIAVGLGPFNLSLACLAEPLEEVKSLFLEQKSEFNWHPGMMLEGVTLQTPFMSDLVTMADPTNPYSFLNYAKQTGNLYPFYIRESFFLFRKEYNQYCQWATQKLSNIRFDTRVTNITYNKAHDWYELSTSSNGQQHTYFAKHIVIGTGPAPYIPDACDLNDSRIIHSSQYMQHRESLTEANRVTVVGGGQSAAEIVHDLLANKPLHQHETALNWVTRSPRYFPLEYTKLTLEMTSPEYVDYFYDLPEAMRDKLNRQQTNLYKGINGTLINDIYDLLYQKRLDGKQNICFKTLSSLDALTSQADELQLTFTHQELNTPYRLNSDYVVLATGYRPQLPTFLEGISEHIAFDGKGRYAVARNYAIDRQQSRIFVQNAEQHTHGFVTPDLGMACYRNSHLLRSITGKEYYTVEEKIAFQTFSLDDVETLDEVNA
ncbi:lysine N(6)-hydroxylase/L-ornithine N(5)-oxygenase family protein [Aestuariibacter sp. AA17]|uniref:Lysine N(6)-hydroxylase/L-ornithine N(5)-oxygenase family protein n=1 Tax=Fluctibacter corallii TaxID=2984329 RepID=A0ABT3A6Z7_9ALTE|nr:lysine N(6)-hydroxylase/L-ornithine N(5)-oxygenase family protein [Aestuariibacter sp. AA17]MCV2884419.1 lysine N(6)-hydroxylase/L-ornithine N(5)-oxygenase family protein [Aestuariibacter sp. AA17]